MRDQVMEIGFMHHRDAGMLQRSLIREFVVRIIAELVHRAVMLRRVEMGLLAERVDVYDFRERFQKRGGIVGDAAPGGRQGREKRNPHQRTSSTENVPSDSGILASSGTCALSWEKKTST